MKTIEDLIAWAIMGVIILGSLCIGSFLAEIIIPYPNNIFLLIIRIIFPFAFLFGVFLFWDWLKNPKVMDSEEYEKLKQEGRIEYEYYKEMGSDYYTEIKNLNKRDDE